MPQPSPPEHASPTVAADAMAALEQAGERAQVLADELAGGFDDIEALRASAPEGLDAGRDLDALLAAAADAAMDGGYELTHAAVAEETLSPTPTPTPTPEPEPSSVTASAPVPEPLAHQAQADPPAAAAVVEESAATSESLDDLVAAAFLDAEASDASGVTEERDEVAGAAFIEPDATDAVQARDERVDDALLEPAGLAEALGIDVPAELDLADAVAVEEPEPEPEPEPAAVMDDAEAFAAALLETHVEAPPPAAPAPEAAADTPAESPAEQGPPQVDPERIQDAISAMEALLAEESETDSAADADAPPASESQASAEAESDSVAAAAATDGDAVSDDELAGLFAAPDVGAGTGVAPEVRALSDAAEEDGPTPPIHPDAAAAADADGAGEGAQGDQGEQGAESGRARIALFPFGWMIALLALINRPLERLSDEWRLAVSGVALAVAVPGALLLGYALFLK